MRKGLSKSGVDGTGFFRLSYISGGGDLGWTSPPFNDEDATSQAARVLAGLVGARSAHEQSAASTLNAAAARRQYRPPGQRRQREWRAGILYPSGCAALDRFQPKFCRIGSELADVALASQRMTDDAVARYIRIRDALAVGNVLDPGDSAVPACAMAAIADGTDWGEACPRLGKRSDSRKNVERGLAPLRCGKDCFGAARALTQKQKMPPGRITGRPIPQLLARSQFHRISCDKISLHTPCAKNKLRPGGRDNSATGILECEFFSVGETNACAD